MRRCLATRSVLLSCAAVLLSAGPAAAFDKYLDLEPPETLSGYGYGYNSIARAHTLKQCVEFGPATIDAGGASGDDLKFDVVTTNDQLADGMDLSVSAKFSMSMGVASASTSAKVKLFQETKTNFYTQTILASWRGVDPMKYIGTEIRLKPEYLAMVGTPAFRQNCGDYFVVGMQQGRWIYGTVQLVVKDTETQSSLAVGGAADVEYGAASAEGSVNTLNTLKNASNSKDLKIRVTSSGTQSAPVDIDQFVKLVQTFPGQKGNKQTFALKAVPYESIVANWPQTNPLAPLTAAAKLDVLAEAAWGLISLIDDSDFVTRNAALFALGTTPAQRTARLNYLKGRKAFYQAQLDDMRKKAQSCDVDWQGTAACEPLYTKWKDWQDFAIAEYGQMPARYTSDCYAARDVTLAGQSVADVLKTAMISATSKWSLATNGGDRDMDDGPTRFSALLDFKPNFSGGDPLAVRELLATLKLKIAEIPADHTTFSTTVSTNVADLSKPDLSGAKPVTLNQCAYRGTGVKATPVSPDPAVCDFLKQINAAAYKDCVETMPKLESHGMLVAKAGEDARQVRFTTGARGVLTSVTCMVSAPGDDDTAAVGCSEIGLKSIQFDLVNRQDLAADAWKTPLKVIDKLGELPRTPVGIAPPSNYTGKLRGLLGKARGTFKPTALPQLRSAPPTQPVATPTTTLRVQPTTTTTRPLPRPLPR